MKENRRDFIRKTTSIAAAITAGPPWPGDSNEKAGYSTIAVLYACGYIRGLMEGVSKQNK
jgi:D-mannonate dehydratase